MYSANSLAGTESSSFWRYWDSLKDEVGKIIAVGPLIRGLWNDAKSLYDRTADLELKRALGEQLSRLSDMLMTYNEVRDKINEYLPSWSAIGKIGLGELDNKQLGILPLVLPAWALASLVGGGLVAIAFVTTHGMDLLKQYQAESNILERLQKGQITGRTAASLIESMKPKGMFSDLTGNLGTMIPVIAGIGLLIFFGPQLMGRYGKGVAA